MSNVKCFVLLRLKQKIEAIISKSDIYIIKAVNFAGKLIIMFFYFFIDKIIKIFAEFKTLCTGLIILTFLN